ncbi:MAG: hypothetical protein LBG05_05565 [Treponema sp.]|nr:hypothetical protein [Treponema sp.]
MKLCLLLFFFLFPTLVFTQETEETQTVYYIENIQVHITGKTREPALLRVGELKKGEEFVDIEKLEKYVKDKEQLLKNQRVLERVKIAYELKEPVGDRVPVTLLIAIVDTYNFIILPEPKFSSSNGLEVEFKTRDYNFLGSMTPLRFDLGYALEADDLWNWEKGSLTLSIDSGLPFQAFGFNWNFNFDHDFKYTFGEPLYYKNISSISVDVPWKRTIFTFGFEENFIFNEENGDAYKLDFGDFTLFYMSSELYTAWKIPFGFEVGPFGELSYTPKISGRINYSPDGIDELHTGPFAIMSHSLAFGKTNWIENYREGLVASLDNSNSFNFYQGDWSVSWGATVMGYKKIANIFDVFGFGVSGRTVFKQWFFTNSFKNGKYPAYSNVGDFLRGVKDNTVIVEDGDVLFAFSVDFPLQVLHFVPSEWFHTRSLRYFNLDFHIAPFIDIAFTNGKKNMEWENGFYHMPPAKDADFSPLFAAGLEVIVFPLAWRSFYLRVSIGYDINKRIEEKDMVPYDEVFIGVGHEY